METAERRREILKLLCRRRYEKIENPITIEVRINRTDILDGLQPNNYIFTGSALNTYNNLKQNETSFKLFKEQRFFKCVSNQTKFENENGIISKMVFEEIEIETRGE